MTIEQHGKLDPSRRTGGNRAIHSTEGLLAVADVAGITQVAPSGNNSNDRGRVVLQTGGLNSGAGEYMLDGAGGFFFLGSDAKDFGEHFDDSANPHGVTAGQAGADVAGSAAAVASDLFDHESDTANPHAVTAAQAAAAPAAHVGAGGGAHADVVAAGADGFMTGADKTKLDGIAAGALGFTVFFGANLGIAGRFATSSGNAKSTQNIALDETSQLAAPVGGKGGTLAWETQSADATTVMKVHKNGIVVDTITLTGQSGSIALSGNAFVAGDLFGLEYDAGTSPGRSLFNVYVTG